MIYMDIAISLVSICVNSTLICLLIQENKRGENNG